MVQGYRAYSGLTNRASYSGTATVSKPDLVVSKDALSVRSQSDRRREFGGIGTTTDI